MIAVGILSVLTAVSLRQYPAGVDSDSLRATGQAMVALHDWTFLLGPGFVAGARNGLILGYRMYRSGLVTRKKAVLGLIGGPLILLSGVAVIFGLYEQMSVWSLIATIPEFAWELSLGVYLMVKGFRYCPVTAQREVNSTPDA